MKTGTFGFGFWRHYVYRLPKLLTLSTGQFDIVFFLTRCSIIIIPSNIKVLQNQLEYKISYYFKNRENSKCNGS